MIQTTRVKMTKTAIFSDLHLGVHQNSDFWLSVANKWADWYITELKKRGHDSWLDVWNSKELWKWLYNQRK